MENKVLIISYYFYPCPYTASERVTSFARSFWQWGMRVHALTRNWNFDYKKFSDYTKESGNEIETERKENYDVTYLPYRNDFRERIGKKFIGTKGHLLFTIINFFYTLIEPVFLFSINRFYRSLLVNARYILKKEQSIDYCIISVAPFMQLKLGHVLKREFPHIKFIADYRDDWNTNDMYATQGARYPFLKNMLKKYFLLFEKRWLSSYSLFSSVSQHYANKISKVLNIKGVVIENGFVKDNYMSDNKSVGKMDGLVITYVGSLYPVQKIEIFLYAVIETIKRGIAPGNLKVKFISLLEQVDQLKRVKNLITGHEGFFELLPRMSKEACIEIQMNSTLLLHVAYGSSKGVPGSKLHEYLALEKPVLLCPTDHDVIESALTLSGQGVFANSVEDCIHTLIMIFDKYRKNHPIIDKVNREYIKKYDREKIAEIFVEELKKI